MATLLVALTCLPAAGCGGGDEASPERETTSAADEPRPETTAPVEDEPEDDEPERRTGGDAKADRDEDDGAKEERLSPHERAAIAAVRDYVAALDARDGRAVCGILAPGAIDAVKLPRERRGCPKSVEASLGYRDPRGLPVWKSSRVTGVASFEVGADSGRVVATVVTEFSDRKQPSIEDDVVYLTRSGDRWLIAKPSTTLYRAVGIADVPPSVLAPPG